jgi:hypothetical protein
MQQADMLAQESDDPEGRPGRNTRWWPQRTHPRGGGFRVVGGANPTGEAEGCPSPRTRTHDRSQSTGMKITMIGSRWRRAAEPRSTGTRPKRSRRTLRLGVQQSWTQAEDAEHERARRLGGVVAVDHREREPVTEPSVKAMPSTTTSPMSGVRGSRQMLRRPCQGLRGGRHVRDGVFGDDVL